MNARRSIVVLALMLVVTVALAAIVVLAQGGYVYENIVLPLSYIFWMLGVLLRGTPQALFWGILLVIALVLIMRSLVVAPPQPPAQIQAESNFYRRPRLRHWVRQILMSRNERYRHYLKEGLGRLALEVLAYQRGLTVNQYQQQIDSSQVQPSEIIAPFLEARQTQFHVQENLDWIQIVRWLQQLMNKVTKIRQVQPNQDKEIDELVNYLEQQMDLE